MALAVTTYVALLRGVNVGGRSKVAMAELRNVFLDVGCTDVRTYIQSGNVVFRCKRSAGSVAGEVAARLAASHELDVAVIVRSSRELDEVVDRNPFGGRARDESKLHVTFLAGNPPKQSVAATRARSFSPDEFWVLDREVYVYCPNGYGRTKINNTFFERSLGVAATTRNWNTVTTLARMATG